MGPARSSALGAAILSVAAAVFAGAPPSEFIEILGQMHPEYRAVVGEVRSGATRHHPAGVAAGLVRAGGLDPLDLRDTPQAGAGVHNDIIVYGGTFRDGGGDAWRRLIVDHEFFHALHLAHGVEAPAVDFKDERVNRDYYEALAWGYNLSRAGENAYPGLDGAGRRSVEGRCIEHRDQFKRWLQREHRAAWEHYGRFIAGLCGPELP
jgi:hypothetical protein